MNGNNRKKMGGGNMDLINKNLLGYGMKSILVRQVSMEKQQKNGFHVPRVENIVNGMETLNILLIGKMMGLK